MHESRKVKNGSSLGEEHKSGEEKTSDKGGRQEA
jgi:hypothetical protein